MGTPFENETWILLHLYLDVSKTDFVQVLHKLTRIGKYIPIKTVRQPAFVMRKYSGQSLSIVQYFAEDCQ